MCGIFALLEPGKDTVDAKMFERMSHSLEHRGPDDNGYAFFEIMGEERVIEARTPTNQDKITSFNGLLTFGHRRLSIIDLSEAGHQPMCNENRTVWVIYNGEIYNYPELTQELLKKGPMGPPWGRRPGTGPSTAPDGGEHHSPNR